jgi:hypothetical protein
MTDFEFDVSGGFEPIFCAGEEFGYDPGYHRMIFSDEVWQAHEHIEEDDDRKAFSAAAELCAARDALLNSKTRDDEFELQHSVDTTLLTSEFDVLERVEKHSRKFLHGPEKGNDQRSEFVLKSCIRAVMIRQGASKAELNMVEKFICECTETGENVFLYPDLLDNRDFWLDKVPDVPSDSITLEMERCECLGEMADLFDSALGVDILSRLGRDQFFDEVARKLGSYFGNVRALSDAIRISGLTVSVVTTLTTARRSRWRVQKTHPVVTLTAVARGTDEWFRAANLIRYRRKERDRRPIGMDERIEKVPSLPIVVSDRRSSNG